MELVMNMILFVVWSEYFSPLYTPLNSRLMFEGVREMVEWV